MEMEIAAEERQRKIIAKKWQHIAMQAAKQQKSLQKAQETARVKTEKKTDKATQQKFVCEVKQKLNGQKKLNRNKNNRKKY